MYLVDTLPAHKKATTLSNDSARKPLITRLRDLVAGDGGFTLLETLAVMVIVGLLAGITVPQISRWREKAYVVSIKTDARNLANALEAQFTENAVYPATGAVTNNWALDNGAKINTGNVVANYESDGSTRFYFTVRTSKVGNKYVVYDSVHGGLSTVVTPVP